MGKNYYDLLEVTQTASNSDIKASFRRLAKQQHPDKNPNSPDATPRFQDLNNAYTTLSDPSKRQQYDQSLRFTSSSTYTSYSHWSAPSGSATSYDTNDTGDWARSIMELEKKLNQVQISWAAKVNEIKRVQDTLFNTRAKLNRLQAEDDKDAQDELARNTWLSFILGPRESIEDKEARERRAVGRRTGRIVLEAQCNQLEAEIATMQSTNQLLWEHLMKHTRDLRTLKTKQEIFERERQKTKQQQEKKAAEESDKLRKEREARLNAEMLRKEYEAQVNAEMLRKEYEAQAKHWKPRPMKPSVDMNGSPAKAKRRQRSPKPPSHTTHNVCSHRQKWTYIRGSHICHICSATMPIFAFKCSSCSKIACARCKKGQSVNK